MSDWERKNGAYLAEGLAWLRGALCGAPGPPWWEDPRWAEADAPPALEWLGERLGMSRFERLALLMVAAFELDPTFGTGANPGGEPVADHPTFSLLLSVLPDPAWDVLAAHRPLRRWQLLEIHGRYGEPLTASRLRADERIVGLLKGLNVLDGRLVAVLRRVDDSLAGPLPASHEAAVGDILSALTEDPGSEYPPIVQLLGVDPLVRRGLAASGAHRVRHELYELAPGSVPVGAERGELLRLWERETLLLPLVLYIDVAEATPEEAGTLQALIEDIAGSVVVGCREPWPLRRRRLRLIDAPRPTSFEQEEIWVATLGDELIAARLASEFDFNQTVIHDVARRFAATPDAGRQLWRACRAQARPGLDSLAQRVEPVATWDDLVLPPAELELLGQLVDQVRGRATVLRSWGLAATISRGSAVTALFAGPSGTGKTLAAEVVANELGLDLYRIDLAGIMSKYIGETERNLRRVFDAAEGGGALLLFDEADSLFGKRSEVKDSHDRYANIEVNYLLTRIEDYRGVAILTSNQRHALDQAFLRRLRFVVPFPFPAPSERAALWARAFPAGAPVAELDGQRLARLAASGGMIRNIALGAAFVAAGREIEVTTDLVLEMARVEFRKLELPINDAQFRPVEASA
jgi:ATPase family associated with various cellular activities (AAA)